MAESLFIEPIRRWFASRAANKRDDKALPFTTLTPEQQLAQLRGLPVAASASAAAEAGAEAAAGSFKRLC